MADNFNRQYQHSPEAMFGQADFSSTHADGSDGIRPNPTAGGSLGEVSFTAATSSLAAGQVESNMPAAPVYNGESQSMSDGIAAHSSSINGAVDQSAMNSGGPWHGDIMQPRRPWNRA